MDRAERRVAVPDRVDEDADAYQVIDLLEADVPGDHLLVDGVVVLRPPGDPCLDLGLAQVGLDLFDDVLQEQLPLGGPLGDHPGDLVVPLGVQGREGEVFQFPLDGVHAQPVRQRGEDLQHLTGLALLLFPWQVAQRAHVVQPVGELDHQHADVAGHGDDHLAHGLGLGGLPVLDPVQLGDPVDQRRHLVAEILAQFGEGVGGVLHGVVQQRGAESVGVHAEFGEDRGHRERVGDVRVAALAHLPGVPVRGHLVGTVDEPDVRLGVSSPHRLDQGFQHRVDPAAAGRAEAGQPAADTGSAGDAGRAGRGLARRSSGSGRSRGCRLLCGCGRFVGRGRRRRASGRSGA